MQELSSTRKVQKMPPELVALVEEVTRIQGARFESLMTFLRRYTTGETNMLRQNGGFSC